MLALVATVIGFSFPQETFKGHTKEVLCVAVSPDGNTVASGSADDTVRLWSAGQSKVLGGHDGDVTCLAFSPDGSTLATGEMYKKVRVYDAATGALKVTIDGLDGRVTGLAFSPDGKTIYASSVDNALRAFAVSGGDAKAKAAHQNQVVGVAVSQDGTVASMDVKGTVRIFGPDLKDKARAQHGESGRSLAFSADGKRLVTSGGTGAIRVWDVAAGAEITGFTGAKLDGLGVAFSPDGTKIAVGTFDNLVVILDAASGSERARFKNHERPVTGVAWSPDGRRVYSASMDMTVRAWPG